MSIVDYKSESAIIIAVTGEIIDNYNLSRNSDSFILNKEIKNEIKLYNEKLNINKYKQVEKLDQVITSLNKVHLRKTIKPTHSTIASIYLNDKRGVINSLLILLEKAKTLYKIYNSIFNHYIKSLNYFKNCDSLYVMSNLSFNITEVLNVSNNYYIIGDCEVDETTFYKKNFLLRTLLDLYGLCLKLLNQVIPYIMRDNKIIGDFEVKIKKFNYMDSKDMALYVISYNIISYIQRIISEYYNIETNFKEIKLTLK